MNGAPLFDWVPPTAPLMARFDGAVYDPARDDKAWTDQLARVYGFMRDQRWRTIAEISAVTGDPQASVSAQLRHLRKPRFGSFVVENRRRAGTLRLYEYQVRPPDPSAPRREHGMDSKRTIQRLREEQRHLVEELKLLRSAALMAVELLEEFQVDGEEGHRLELVVQKLRERAAGMQRVEP